MERYYTIGDYQNAYRIYYEYVDEFGNKKGGVKFIHPKVSVSGISNPIKAVLEKHKGHRCVRLFRHPRDLYWDAEFDDGETRYIYLYRNGTLRRYEISNRDIWGVC